jgi:hypothetical protein
MEGMTPEQREVFEFERQASHGKYAGAKEARVRETFGTTMTRYYKLLDAAIDSQQAMMLDPHTTMRLRGLRTARRAARTASRLGVELA